MEKYNDMTYEELLKAKEDLNKHECEMRQEYRLINQAIHKKQRERFAALVGQYVKCCCEDEDQENYYLMKITDINENEIVGIGISCWYYDDEFPDYNFERIICIDEWEWCSYIFTQLTEKEYKSLVEDILNKCREMVM